MKIKQSSTSIKVKLVHKKRVYERKQSKAFTVDLIRTTSEA